jgi:tripartite-type tricarboxylate transporter receptor subunit TctC
VLLLVGYAPGGVNDIVARLTGQMVAERLGQQFIIENRPGAGSNLATEAVVRANPDGYTLLEASTSNGWNATLYQNLKFDFIRDIAPVASSVKTYNVMIVNPAFPAKTVPEFIAYAKANPGKINMGSAGPGSTPHLYGELFKAMTGVDMVTVHYRGDGPAIPELIAGRIQVIFGSVVTWAEQIKAGTVRALAVTSATRTQLFPDLPPIGEFVPGYEGIGWQGDRRAKEHAGGNHRQAQRCDQCRAGRSQIQVPVQRAGRGDICRLARRFRQVHRRLYREMGKDNPRGRRQG